MRNTESKQSKSARDARTLHGSNLVTRFGTVVRRGRERKQTAVGWVQESWWNKLVMEATGSKWRRIGLLKHLKIF